MKLLLVGVLVGLAIGVGITVVYFALATFFELNAKALEKEALNSSLKAPGIANERDAQNVFAEEAREDERKVASQH